MTPASDRGTPTPAWLHGAVDAVRRDGAVLGFLSAMFIGRWMLADWNSYWLDELLSVNVYGLWHPTTLGALRALAENSIHPPLYQFVLYQWMSIFGASEVATRSLSNLYVTLAALFLYLLLRQVWSLRLSFLSVAAFSVMYTPTYYALETRSYAQTIFLVTFSSWLMLWLLRRSREEVAWASWATLTAVLFFVGANTALLMTHYYNIFWVAAQGAFATIYVAREWRRRRWGAGVLSLAVAYGTPLLLFWVTWGGVFSQQRRDRSDAWPVAADGPEHDPADLLIDRVLVLNIEPPRPVGWLLAALVAGLVVWAAISVVLKAPAEDRDQPWTALYLATWMVLPLVVVWAAFLVLGVERYSSRYFVYSVVPMAPLIILAIDRSVGTVKRLEARNLAAPLSTVLAVTVVLAWLVPLGHAAATERKHDWRGIVRSVVDAIEPDEDNDYIVFETAHRRRPMTDFYFEQYSGRIRVYDTLQRYEERQGGPWRILDEHEGTIAEHDRLVLLFTHSRTTHFPEALDRLEERYDIVHRQLNHMGRGFIVYAVD